MNWKFLTLISEMIYTSQVLEACVNLKWLAVVQNKLESLNGIEALSKLTVSSNNFFSIFKYFITHLKKKKFIYHLGLICSIMMLIFESLWSIWMLRFVAWNVSNCTEVVFKNSFKLPNWFNFNYTISGFIKKKNLYRLGKSIICSIFKWVSVCSLDFWLNN